MLVISKFLTYKYKYVCVCLYHMILKLTSNSKYNTENKNNSMIQQQILKLIQHKNLRGKKKLKSRKNSKFLLEREGFGDTGGGGGERGAEIGQVEVVLVVTHFVFVLISLFGRRENKMNPRERKWEKRRENEIEREFVSLTFLKVRRFFGFLFSIWFWWWSGGGCVVHVL